MVKGVNWGEMGRSLVTTGRIVMMRSVGYTGTDVVPNIRKFPVPVIPAGFLGTWAYRTHGSGFMLSLDLCRCFSDLFQSTADHVQ